MKKIYSIGFLLHIMLGFSQALAPANPYYSGFDWTVTGIALKSALTTKTITKHTNLLSYTPGVWEASKITDLDPTNSANVILVYGFENGTDAIITNDRTRSKLSQGGNNGNWNREHVYAKSLGTPALLDGGTANTLSSDAGEDAHHLRPADVQWNSQRGNTKFAAGLGNSGDVATGWYPGDEWKGDIARMMMYMYLRYPTQCLPTGVGTGSSPSSDPNMLNLFLQWNVEDPVSPFEDKRNTYHDGTSTYAQGNRNPFIDNPYLATVIWGGIAAENRWPTILSNENFDVFVGTNIYPNPTNDGKINIESNIAIDEVELITINGQLLQAIQKPLFNNNLYTLENLPKGFYFLKMNAENQSTTRKIIIN